MRLNLYGLNREVSKIVVTDTTADPDVSYTLNCSTAVRVGNSESNATPFLIVVPAENSCVFKVEVTAGDATSSLDPVPQYSDLGYSGNGIVITAGTFLTSSAKTFTAGKVLNMPAKLISAVWAPVNCGYDATNYKYGKLYQWGRKDGGEYNNGSTITEIKIQTTTTGPVDADKEDASKFYTNESSPYDWLSSKDDTRWNSGTEASPVKTTNYDPCPTGWRVPTQVELTALLGSHKKGDLQDGTGVHIGMKGKWFDGSTTSEPTSGVFLSAAGYRYFDDGNAYYRGTCGDYWSSSVDGDNAKYLYFEDGYAYMDNNARADGFSVRCVQE